MHDRHPSRSGRPATARGPSRTETNAKQRDRYRAVLLAMAGAHEGDAIAARLGRSPRFVDEWVARYRHDGGIAALLPRKQPGARPKLTAGQERLLKARLDAGPIPPRDGGVCTLRGRDAVRICREELGVRHTLGSIYGVLGRIGYACLAPRPRHEKNDPAAVASLKAGAPLLSGT